MQHIRTLCVLVFCAIGVPVSACLTAVEAADSKQRLELLEYLASTIDGMKPCSSVLSVQDLRQLRIELRVLQGSKERVRTRDLHALAIFDQIVRRYTGIPGTPDGCRRAISTLVMSVAYLHVFYQHLCSVHKCSWQDHVQRCEVSNNRLLTNPDRRVTAIDSGKGSNKKP